MLPVIGTIDVPSGFPVEPNEIIASTILLIVGIAGLVFFAMLIMGGLKYLTAGGDEKAVTAARQTLTNAFIGLVIVAASFLVAQLIFTIFNINTFVQVINPPTP